MGRPPSDDPRVTIGMRIPTRTVDRIDTWAAGRGLSRADAFRVLLQSGMNTLIGPELVMSPAPITDLDDDGRAAIAKTLTMAEAKRLKLEKARHGGYAKR